MLMFGSLPAPPPSSCRLALRQHRLPLLSVIFPKAISPQGNRLLLAVACCAHRSEDHSNGRRVHGPFNASKKSYLSNLVQEIEPLDVSFIQKDVPPETVDAMKRTISSMLGLLPSDQFQVLIEAFWEPLSKLLVSSMMTGYTLWNAEYRLCLERNFDLPSDDYLGKQILQCAESDFPGKSLECDMRKHKFQEGSERIEEPTDENIGVDDLGELTPEAQEYIIHLKSRLNSAKNELHEMKRENAALQMQHFVGEEKNNLLDYLRSLQPEKVAELSEATSPELLEIVYSVVHGLLATLSPKMHSKPFPQSENPTPGTVNTGREDCAELLENTSLQFQPLISVSRDYLARLLFWCMLLGHHLRGLEYRMELNQLLTLCGSSKSDA